MTRIPNGFKHFMDGSCLMGSVTTIIPIGFKHFVDGSCPVERVPDDQNSLAALHCLPLTDQQNYTLLKVRQLNMARLSESSILRGWIG